jgi:hypothetical protein
MISSMALTRLRPEAALSPVDFLAKYEAVLRSRRIRVGASFAPEQFGATSGADAAAVALRALQTAVEDVGITDLRLGLRWDHLCPDGETFSDFYAPFIEYCCTSPLVQRLYFDIGPIKTFRWPEVHVPQPVIDRLERVPPRGAAIDAGTELAERSLAHVERTLQYLGAEFGVTKPVTFSVNEPFNAFGPRRWTMSERYLHQFVTTVIESHGFADVSFIVSSAEAFHLDRVAAFIRAAIAEDPRLQGRFTSGFNHYPFLPPVVAMPIAREVLDIARDWHRRWRGAARRNWARARDPFYGYRIEVSEAQCEPWGPEQRAGNSVALYQHVLADCIDGILDPQQDESVIRMWGIEHQLQRAATADGAENRAILDLTRAINAL